MIVHPCHLTTPAIDMWAPRCNGEPAGPTGPLVLETRKEKEIWGFRASYVIAHQDHGFPVSLIFWGVGPTASQASRDS